MIKIPNKMKEHKIYKFFNEKININDLILQNKFGSQWGASGPSRRMTLGPANTPFRQMLADKLQGGPSPHKPPGSQSP